MPDISEGDLRVRHFIVSELAETGRAPMLEDVAMEMGMRMDALRATLQRLHDAHLLVLDGDGRLLMVLPFSNGEMGNRVNAGGTGFDVPSVFEALGILALLGRDGVATVQVPGEQGKFRVQLRNGQLQADEALVHFPLPPRQWWDDIVNTCAHILLFRTEEAVDAWCSAQGVARGAVLPLTQAWALAQPWYGNRLDADYTGRSTAEAEALLTELGLDDAFWSFAV